MAVGLRLQLFTPWFSLTPGTPHSQVACVSQEQRTTRPVYNAQRAAKVPPDSKGTQCSWRLHRSPKRTCCPHIPDPLVVHKWNSRDTMKLGSPKGRPSPFSLCDNTGFALPHSHAPGDGDPRAVTKLGWPSQGPPGRGASDSKTNNTIFAGLTGAHNTGISKLL